MISHGFILRTVLLSVCDFFFFLFNNVFVLGPGLYISGFHFKVAQCRMNKMDVFKNLSSCGLPFRDLPSFFKNSLQVPVSSWIKFESV